VPHRRAIIDIDDPIARQQRGDMVGGGNIHHQEWPFHHAICPLQPHAPVEIACTQQGDSADTFVARRNVPHCQAVVHHLLHDIRVIEHSKAGDGE
jgi:hypothetical protein